MPDLTLMRSNSYELQCQIAANQQSQSDNMDLLDRLQTTEEESVSLNTSRDGTPDLSETSISFSPRENDYFINPIHVDTNFESFNQTQPQYFPMPLLRVDFTPPGVSPCGMQYSGYPSPAGMQQIPQQMFQQAQAFPSYQMSPAPTQFYTPNPSNLELMSTPDRYSDGTIDACQTAFQHHFGKFWGLYSHDWQLAQTCQPPGDRSNWMATQFKAEVPFVCKNCHMWFPNQSATLNFWYRFDWTSSVGYMMYKIYSGDAQLQCCGMKCTPLWYKDGHMERAVFKVFNAVQQNVYGRWRNSPRIAQKSRKIYTITE